MAPGEDGVVRFCEHGAVRTEISCRYRSNSLTIIEVPHIIIEFISHPARADMIATAPLIFYRLCLLTEFAEKGLQCLLSDWSGAKQSSAEEYVNSVRYSQECMIANELVGV